LGCTVIFLAGILTLSAVTAVPRSEWVIARGMLLTALGSLYFMTIGLRTQVIVYQTSRNRPQTFDRPASEWITVSFLVFGIGTIFLPHSL
jgi:hypothetical protein